MTTDDKRAIDRIRAVEGGRFFHIFAACDGFSSTCFRCSYFDKRQPSAYRCYVEGSCPAATIQPSVIQKVLR